MSIYLLNGTLAKFIDGIIIGAVNMITSFLQVLLSGSSKPNSVSATTFGAIEIFLFFLQMGISIGYATWFVGKYAATPGKMACGLKIVMADGGRVTYWRACGRHFSEILSALILYIGYIMAGFDNEKRALHDRICNTRVVRK
jgi:uncharacterized RDD family membrane protein YckC